jgi:hypothetical protein
MQMKGKKTVEFRLIDSNEMPPIVIKKNEQDNACVIVLNQAHTIWLSLQRNTIPGIVQSLAEKLNQLCDGYLEEQLMFAQMDNLDTED